jgi:hypothetical protein
MSIFQCPRDGNNVVDARDKSVSRVCFAKAWSMSEAATVLLLFGMEPSMHVWILWSQKKWLMLLDQSCTSSFPWRALRQSSLEGKNSFVE